MSDVCCANLRSGRSPQPQQLVRIQYKGIVFDEPLRFDILVDSCLLLELKALEALHPFSKAQLFSYMKVLDVPVGLLINFHEPVLKNGISRLILPGANQMERSEANEVSFWTCQGVLRYTRPTPKSSSLSCLRIFVFFC